MANLAFYMVQARTDFKHTHPIDVLSRIANAGLDCAGCTRETERPRRDLSVDRDASYNSCL